MKKPCILLPLIAISALAVNVCKGTTVFDDTFSRPNTELVGSVPDVGAAWTGTSTAITASSTLDTTGAARQLYAAFNSTLGVGEVLTLSFDTLFLGNFLGGNGYAGVSLYVGGTERAYTGQPWMSGEWGLDFGGGSPLLLAGDSTKATTATFTYVYDTGAFTFATATGGNLAGFANAGLAFDQLRVQNDNGADINVDNLHVDISPVPEPTSLALIGLGGLGLAIYRRRH